VQYDNSASRLNVSKAGIASILQNFLPNADFGLIDYQLGAPSLYQTWVYYMSNPGGFTFTNAPGASRYVPNPCFGIALDTANPVDSSCKSLAALYPGIGAYADMLIASSSDDPAINDVLYAGGVPAVCVVYGGPSPANPYAFFGIGSYETGGVYTLYSTGLPSGCATETGPTNAGYVPFTPQVMYAERGFGYYVFSQTAAPATNTSWPVLVPMTSAGQVPTTASVAAAAAKFAPYLAPETNSTSTTEIKALAAQSPIAGLLQASYDYFVATPPASSNGCTPKRYVVLVTDGLPTMDLVGHNWPPLGSASAAGYGVTATFNADGSLSTGNTNDQALIDAINTLSSLYAKGVKVFIIGVGAGVDPAANPTAAATLTAMAIAGGSGNYFAATTEAQLDTDMQAILAQVLAETSATSASSVNSTGVNSKSVAYQGQFDTSDAYQDWTGNMLAFPINTTTGAINTSVSNELWATQPLLDAQNWQNGRMIVTWDPVAQAGTPFEWFANTSASIGIAPSTTLGQALETFSADTSGNDVVSYLRGNTALEKRNGGQFRNRSHILGDIVDSAPAYVAGPSAPWQTSSYFTFAANNANRRPMLYVGANDGMLHAIDASVNKVTSGQELFAFIPNGVWNNLVNLVNPYYNEQHRFYVDGSPVAQDVQFSDGTWHTVLVGGERAGGMTFYALDVTSPATAASETALASTVLWEMTDANMGYTYSEPLFASTAAGFAILVGNGYDSPQSRPVFYAINPQTGAIMAKIDLCASAPTACNAALANGLSSVMAMNSYGSLSGQSNVAYAGDLQGNLWRINMSSANPASWTATVLFQARDPGGTPQPITVVPAVTMNPLYPQLKGAMVYFATGQLLSITDLTNTQVQTVYGIYDNEAGATTPLTRASLQQQTLSNTTATNSSGTTVSLRMLTSVAVNLPSQAGWYVDLSLTVGERVVTDPQLFNGSLQLTSYQPNTSTCTGGGNGWFMVFNYATGGATGAQQFGWYTTTSITTADTISGKVVSGISLGANYGSSPAILTSNTGAGSAGAVAYVTVGGAEGGTGLLSNGSSFIENWAESNGASRGSWQEIRH
jgi:type IV pilus assembly protein PilY1